MRGSSLRWTMIALAFLATLINYLDRQALSVAAPILRSEFALTSTDYSHILFAFMLAYTIMNGVSGMLIDRLGTRAGYGLFVAWWSISALLHSFARGSLSLGIFRFLLGMGEAGNWPGAVKVVAEWFPPEERPLASGIFNSGSSIGAILAPPVIAFTVIRFGWRSAFVVVASSGFLWLALWMLLYRSPQPDPAQSSAPGPVPLRALINSRFLWIFTVSKIFIDPVWYFYIFWYPEYLFHGRHFDMAQIGEFAWIPFFVAAAGNIGGALIAKAFQACGVSVSHARRWAVTAAALMMASAIPAVLVPSPLVSIALVSIAMAGYTAALANMLAIPSEAFPSRAVASVYGLASMGSGTGGMIFALITGWLVDRYSYLPVFYLFGLIPLLGCALLWTCIPANPQNSTLFKEELFSQP